MAHKHPNYWIIWFWLAFLTVLELGAAKLTVFGEGWWTIAVLLLVGLAISKALLVALYFMHLRWERKSFIALVSAPTVLAVILVVALLPDLL